MPCYVTVKNPYILNLIGDKKYETPQDINEAIRKEIANGKEAIFQDSEGNTYSAYVLSIDENLNSMQVNKVPMTPQNITRGLVNPKTFAINTLQGWGSAPVEVKERPSIEELSVNPASQVVTIEETLKAEPEHPEIPFIKVDLFSTTTLEADGKRLDGTPLKKAQRKLLQRINPDDYYAVMLKDQEGIMIEPNQERTGEVILVVHKSKVATKDNILEVAERVNNQVIPLYFEAPLTQTQETSSFFGKKQDTDRSRTESNHDERIRIRAEQQEITQKQAREAYQTEFKEVQDLRSKDFVELELKRISPGHRPRNKQVFSKLGRQYAPTRDRITLTKDGLMFVTYNVDGQDVTIPVKATRFSDKEKEYLEKNLDRYNKGDVNVREMFHLLLGQKKRGRAFFEGQTLMYNDGKKTYSVNTKEELQRFLNLSPFRNTTVRILQEDKRLPVSIDGYDSVFTYFASTHYPTNIMYEVDGQVVPDVANRYISLGVRNSENLDGSNPTTVQKVMDVLDMEKYVDQLQGQLNVKDKVVLITEPTVIDTPQGKRILVPKDWEATRNTLRALSIKTGLKKVHSLLINGAYDPNNNVIYHNGDPSVLLEESIHALTARFIKENPNDPLVRRIDELRTEAKKVLGKDLKYSVSNNVEFIARALSHPPTMQRLREKLDKSWFEKLIDVFRQVLSRYGIADPPHGMYAELLSIFDTIKDKSPKVDTRSMYEKDESQYMEDLDFPFSVRPVSLNNVKTLEEARSLDSLFVQLLNVSGYDLAQAYNGGIKMSVALDQIVENLDHPFVDKVRNNKEYYLSIWPMYSKIFERVVLEERDHQQEVEEGKSQKEFDRLGTEDPSIALVPNPIRRLYASLVDTDEYSTGISKLKDPYKVHYEVLDLLDKAPDLKTVIRRLGNSEYSILLERLNIDPNDLRGSLQGMTWHQRMMVAQFWRSVHMPSLDYYLLTEVDGRKVFKKQTGRTDDAIYARSNREVSTLLKLRPQYGESGNINQNYRDMLIKTAEAEDFTTFQKMLGIESEIDPKTLSLLKQFKAKVIEDIEKLGDVHNPLESLVRLENSQGTTYRRLMDLVRVKKNRSVTGFDGNLISAESLPNSMTQIAEMVNDQTQDLPYFLNNPRFNNSLSKRRIEQGDKIELISYGGVESIDKSVKLSTKDWVEMNLETMLDSGYMEIMRTESSGSAWAFRVGKHKQWVNNKQEFVNAFKGYFMAELQTMSNRDLVEKVIDGEIRLVPRIKDYTGHSLTYFDFIKQPGLREGIESDVLTLTPEEVFEKYWPSVSGEVANFLEEEVRSVTETVTSLKLEKTYDLRRFTMNYLIQNIEESFLFSHSLDYYKDFHKRAKGKISTGATPIPDPEFWESMDTNTISGNQMSSLFKTFNVKEDTEGYVGPLKTLKSGRLVPETETEEYKDIFLPAIEAKVNHLIQLGHVKPLNSKGYDRKDLVGVWNDLFRKYMAYDEMDIGDGGGYVSMDYYRAYLMSVGNWSIENERHYQWERLYYKRFFLGQTLNNTQPYYEDGQLTVNGQTSFTEAEFFRTRAALNSAQTSLKVSYFGPEYATNHPVFDKFALVPLTPSVVFGTKLQGSIGMMAKTNTAYLKFNSGTKAAKAEKGHMSDVTLFGLDRSPLFNEESTLEEIKEKSYTLDVRFLKEQLRTNATPKSKNIFGTQFRKLAYSDVFEYGVPRDFMPTTEKELNELYNKVRGEFSLERFKSLSRGAIMRSIAKYYKTQPKTSMHQRYDNYKKLLDDQVRISREKLLEELGFIDTDKGLELIDVQATLQLLKRKTQDRSQALIEFIEMNQTVDNKLVIPFEASPVRQQFQNIITSVIQKRLTRLKVNGSQMVQVPPTGMEQDTFSYSEERYKKTKESRTQLRYYRMEDGKVKPAETFLTMTPQFKGLENREDVVELAKKERISRFKALNLLLEDDIWYEKNKDLVTVLAYRIPTQGLSSMEVLRIRRFLPSTSGKAIIPPLEIVAKSGSDYDIDKLSVLFPNITASGTLVKDPKTYDKEKHKLLQLKIKKVVDELKEIKGLSKENKQLLSVARVMAQDSESYVQYQRMLEETRDVLGEDKVKLLEELRDLYAQNAQFQADKLGQAAENENLMLQNLREQILDPNNYHQLLTPLTTLNIKDELRKNGKDWYTSIDDPRKIDIVRFRSNLLKRQALLVGQQLLGIAAKANVFNQLFQAGNLKMKYSRLELLTKEEENLLRDGNWYDMSSQITLDGLLKSELFNQFVNATVDAAKEDYLGYANFNPKTMGPVMYAIMLGIPPKRVFTLIHTEAVRSYSQGQTVEDLENKYMNLMLHAIRKEVGNIEPDALPKYLKDNPDTPAKELINDYLKRLNTSYVPTDIPNMESRRKEERNYWFYRKQLDSIRAFSNLESMANQLLVAQQALRFDTNPLKTPTESFEEALKLNKAEKSRVAASTLKSIIKDSVISAFNSSGDYLEIMGSLMPTLFNAQTLEKFKGVQVPKFQTRETLDRLLTNDLMEYLIKTRGRKDNKTLGQWAQDELQNIDKYTDVPVLLQELDLFKDVGKGSIDGQNFLNLQRGAKDKDLEDIYYNDLRTALELEPEFTKDFVLLAFLQTGFNRTFYSFADIIPPSMLSETLGALLDTPPTKDELNKFVRLFQQNNGQLYGRPRSFYKYGKPIFKEPSEVIKDADPNQGEVTGDVKELPFDFSEKSFNLKPLENYDCDG